MKRFVFVLFCLTITGVAWAQQPVTPIIPFSTPAPLIQVTPDANDARAASCDAPMLPHFVPYVVRPGDRLGDLIADNNAVTVTQLAALNCIDDPDALPVGATIWLPGASPEAAAQVTAEATTEAAAQIASLSASSEVISSTDTVTFRWSATGSAAYFYLCPVEACVRPQTAPPLPVSGSLSKSNFRAAGTYTYRLEVDGAGSPVTQDITLTVTCAQTWLGGVGAQPLCPDDPAISVYGVWQPFEGGAMLWLSDVKQIYVMTNDGRFRVYQDEYIEGQPDPADQAPSGRFTPVRGFGAIWKAIGGADSPLGWALAKEKGYDAARQAAGRTSYTTYLQGPGSIVYAVTQIPGQAEGYWAQVSS